MGRKDWDPRPRRPERADLDEFTDKYFDTLMSESSDDEGDPLDVNYTSDHVADDTLFDIERDAHQFLIQNWEDLQGRDLRKAAWNFYYARNDYPVGFQGWPDPEAAKRLKRNARAMGWYQLYMDVDDLIRAEWGA